MTLAVSVLCYAMAAWLVSQIVFGVLSRREQRAYREESSKFQRGLMRHVDEVAAQAKRQMNDGEEWKS